MKNDIFNQLLPCPFCGETPKIYNTIGGWYRIVCWDITKCPLRPFADSEDKEELIRIWNKRT